MSVSTRIDGLLAEQGLKRIDLSRGVGISESTIRGWKSTESSPKYSDLLRVAYYLRTTPEYLYTGDKAYDYQCDNLSGVPIERPARPDRAHDPLDKLRAELKQKTRESNLTQSEIDLVGLYRSLSLNNQELAVRLLRSLANNSQT